MTAFISSNCCLSLSGVDGKFQMFPVERASSLFLSLISRSVTTFHTSSFMIWDYAAPVVQQAMPSDVHTSSTFYWRPFFCQWLLITAGSRKKKKVELALLVWDQFLEMITFVCNVIHTFVNFLSRLHGHFSISMKPS